MGINVVSENACSGCWAEFRHIYYSIGDDKTALAGTTFVLGEVKKMPRVDECVIIGTCAKAVADQGAFVPGCPPHHREIEKAARRVSSLPPAEHDPFDV